MPDKNNIPINSLLAVGCVHQKLVELGLRSKANIIVTSSSARDTHQIACLIGFGATAVYPTLAYQTILYLTERNELKGSPHENCARYRKGVNKGLLKIISKMGISTISSYRGSQLFEIIGLNSDIVDLCFTNTESRIGGKNLEALDKDRDFLKKGDVFTDDMLDGYIDLKMEEVTQFRLSTHPLEFELYYSL